MMELLLAAALLLCLMLLLVTLYYRISHWSDDANRYMRTSYTTRLTCMYISRHHTVLFSFCRVPQCTMNTLNLTLNTAIVYMSRKLILACGAFLIFRPSPQCLFPLQGSTFKKIIHQSLTFHIHRVQQSEHLLAPLQATDPGGTITMVTGSGRSFTRQIKTEDTPVQETNPATLGQLVLGNRCIPVNH